MSRKTTLVLSAHTDDHVAGAGGAIAKAAKHGWRIKTVVFSFGEASHPHYLPEVWIERRKRESLRADKILGGDGVTFLGLAEGRFRQDMPAKMIKKIVRRYRPARIFTHSPSTMHPDHKAIVDAVRALQRSRDITCEVLCFEGWMPVRIRGRGRPLVIIDITDTFQTKMRAIRACQTRHLGKALRIGYAFLRALAAGWRSNWQFAEAFTRL